MQGEQDPPTQPAIVEQMLPDYSATNAAVGQQIASLQKFTTQVDSISQLEQPGIQFGVEDYLIDLLKILHLLLLGFSNEFFDRTNFAWSSGGPSYITSYDYDGPIDEYGLLGQPKWGHLKDLRAAIKLCEPALAFVDSPQYVKNIPVCMNVIRDVGKVIHLGDVNTPTKLPKNCRGQSRLTLSPCAVAICFQISVIASWRGKILVYCDMQKLMVDLTVQICSENRVNLRGK
ncbi:hypothetical protein Nepgr_010571 [Nepenthes gracilis]|uniref:beta-galactosidase n=1 Tax=Nepenthes gracilis TaxID=150966 RepID=A0AAD3XLJ4_NEPGR|nr:hypothetical protein Nepgr_010571 [Nepenthes gracilis]